MKFTFGTAYPIETLPDDLYDKTIPNRDRWAIRGAMFWNDCEGWWQERSIAGYWRSVFGSSHVARFWMPMAPDPMTREQILAERGMVVCPDCDMAIHRERAHDCRPSDNLVEQRRLQAIVDGKKGD